MENWPVLISFYYPLEAHLAKGYLEANGIETILKDELTSQVAQIYAPATGGVKLMISSSDYDQGILLLKEGGYLADQTCEIKNRVEVVLVDCATNKKICPFCSSENIVVISNHGIFATPVYAIINLFFLIGVIFPLFKSSFKCLNCTRVWMYAKQ